MKTGGEIRSMYEILIVNVTRQARMFICPVIVEYLKRKTLDQNIFQLQ